MECSLGQSPAPVCRCRILQMPGVDFLCLMTRFPCPEITGPSKTPSIPPHTWLWKQVLTVNCCMRTFSCQGKLERNSTSAAELLAVLALAIESTLLHPHRPARRTFDSLVAWPQFTSMPTSCRIWPSHSWTFPSLLGSFLVVYPQPLSGVIALQHFEIPLCLGILP